MTLYPLALRLDGRRVLVVGGGAVATRRVPALLHAGAHVVIVSPTLTPALQTQVDAGRVHWEPRRFMASDLDDVWLVHVAVDDGAAAATVSAAALERRIFCVRADDRHAATAWTPAVTRHGPVTVAVIAGGEPRRAVAIRDAIRSGLESGTLAGAPGTAGTTSPAGRGGAGDPPERAGSAPLAGSTRVTGRVILVGAGPGDPELITVKGRRMIAAADVVVADRLVPGLLLDELRPDVELVDASKIPYGPAKAQEEINRILVERALDGHLVVRLKGGDPYVFGRGGEEVIACTEAGVPVTVVPGVSSSIAAPALAGIPVTHRGVAHEFTVVSGHVPPEHPTSLVDWAALARMRGTLVVLMGLKNLAAITGTLVANGRPADTPAAVVQEGTTGAQRTLRSTLGEVADDVVAAGLRPPAVLVVGPVVAAIGSWTGDRDPTGPIGG